MKAVTLVAAALLELAACTSAPPQMTPQPSAAAVWLDRSYDWHVLLTAPLGSILKDLPFPVHEVLLFREAAESGSSDEGDCYVLDGPVPTFIARVPDEYLLCFKHDRLERVVARVSLPQDQSAQVFADACGLWFRNAALAPPTVVAATESAPAGCTGHDGLTQFSARLEIEPEQAAALLSIKIDAVAQQ